MDGMPDSAEDSEPFDDEEPSDENDMPAEPATPTANQPLAFKVPVAPLTNWAAITNAIQPDLSWLRNFAIGPDLAWMTKLITSDPVWTAKLIVPDLTGVTKLIAPNPTLAAKIIAPDPAWLRNFAIGPDPSWVARVLTNTNPSWVFTADLFKNVTAFQNDLLQSFNTNLVQNLWEHHGPQNWALLGFNRRAQAEDVIRDEGIPLVWVPRSELVVELCDAPDFAARCQVLDDHAADVMEDCRKVLAEIPAGGRVPKLISEAEQAIGSFEAGFPGPAQSHAANLVDSTLRNMNRQGAAFGTLPKFVYSTVVKLCDTTSGTTTLVNYRSVWVLGVMPMTFTTWNPDKGDPVPTTFSRHATSHALDDPDHHCRVNAIVSIMVAVSLLREVYESSW